MSNTTPFQWYLGIDNQANGPLSASEVAAFFACGQANAKTQVWTAGMSDWAEAGSIEALKLFVEPPTEQMDLSPSDLHSPETPATPAPTSPTSPTSPKALSSASISGAQEAFGPKAALTPDGLGPAESFGLVKPAVLAQNELCAGPARSSQGELDPFTFHPEMSFEEIIVGLGLTLQQVQTMASNSVETANHAKSSMKLSPPQRWGLFKKN